MTTPSSPTPSGRPVWLLPVTALFLAAIVWAFISQRRAPSPATTGPASPPPATTPIIQGSAAPATPARIVAAFPAGAELAPAPDSPETAPPITPELRLERESLFQRLSGQQDPTLAAVSRAFEIHGIRQPDVVASGWILAQHWAIAARAEVLVEAKVEDPAKRKELAELRQRILIQAAEGEVRGLLGASVDSRVLAELESIGRALKDSPPPLADLLPNRAAARAIRDARPPRPNLPQEE